MKSLNKLKVASLVLAIMAAPIAHAWEVPFLAPDYCKDSVIQRPDGAGGFYRSESCKTVFVLPPQEASAKYTMSAPSVTDDDCDEYRDNRQYKRKLYKEIQELQTKINDPKISESTFELLQRKIDSAKALLNDIDKGIKYLSHLEGARMTVSLTSELSNEVSRFQFINQLLFSMGTRFEAVPISESYVSFSTVDEDDLESNSAVISSDIPGVEVRGVKSAPHSDTRIMNGGVKGLVRLGLNAICKMRDLQKVESVNDIVFSPSQLESYIVANLTYSVPVMSSYRYEASMDYGMIVTSWFKKFEEHPDQFTVTSLTDEILSGDMGSAVAWKFEALELQSRGITSKELTEWANAEKDRVFSDFARRLADAMVAMGILERLEPTPIPVPQPGTVEETYYREVCRNKSFAGVRYSHRCWNEPYRVVRLHGSSADQVVNTLRLMNVNFSEKVEYKQPIFRTHTSTFKYVPMN